jgi:hypothetical protein
LFPRRVKVNLKVDRQASPEVSLEVEVGCTLFISAVSGSFWDSILFPLRFKVNLKVDREASLEVSLKVEVGCTQFLWDSILVTEVVGLKVGVM